VKISCLYHLPIKIILPF